MTWEELKGKANEIFKDLYNTSSEYLIGIYFENCELYFKKDGNIEVEFSMGLYNIGEIVISEGRTYEQMYQIMLALR